MALNTHDSPWSPPNVTVFPNAINFGASFDPELAARVANATASELRGVNELTHKATGYAEMAGPICDVGPMANTAHDPRWGRIAQVYSEDPFLAGTMASAVVTGLQQKTHPAPRGGGDSGGLPSVKVAVTVGLFLGYHSDKSGQVPRGHDAFTLTPRDLHDQYLPAYRRALQGPQQALGVMCSHASMNGVPSCASQLLLNKTLRHDWQSEAVVRTDCCGDMQGIVGHGYVNTVQEAVVSAVSAGLQYCFGCGNTADVNASIAGFDNAIRQGALPQSSLDSAVAAGLVHRFQLGEFDNVPEEGAFGSGYADTVDSAVHRALARELVAASVVVMENDGILPLVVSGGDGDIGGGGRGGGSGGDGGGGGAVAVAVIGPFADCTTLPSYTDRPWASPNCYCHDYAGVPSKITTVYQGLAEALPGRSVAKPSDTSVASAVRLAKGAGVVVLALGLGRSELESVDRYNLTLPSDQQTLLKQVTAVANKVVLLLFAAGPVDYSGPGAARWPANAVLQVGYPGEEAGSGIADVLVGHVNPSGRLPLTWVKNEYLAHVGNLTQYSTAGGAGRTYRYIANTTDHVNYWFGHGLSYTQFAYDNVVATPMTEQGVVRVSLRLHNVGQRDGAEVVQVYVTAPPLPPGKSFPTPTRSLCGTAKVAVAKGAVSSVVINVATSCMATVQPDGSAVLSHDGEYHISVGGNQPGDPNGRPTTVVKVKATALHA